MFQIIQGGMGVLISGWILANAVSRCSKSGMEILGTVSGVALERVVAFILRTGGKDADDIIRVLRNSPFEKIREMAERIIEKYHRKPNVGIPVYSVNPSRSLIELTICANYAAIILAKEGHENPVSVNYLEKIAMPHLYAIFGAMLAGVDFITMGAGIPIQIPAVLSAFCEGRTATYKISVIGGDDHEMSFNPDDFFGEKISTLKKPGFIPIISSNILATILEKKLPKGSIYGFVVEKPTAGGHNAPPRNKVDYGPKDLVDFAKLKELGIPFWIGGSCATPEGLKEAQSLGAEGIQAGSIFALSNNSGMDLEIRREVRKQGFNRTLRVRTDMLISPTGFPFKMVELENTISAQGIYEARKRVCSQGALVSLYQKPDGTIGYRCASEPVDAYIRKGGKLEDTVGRGCVCNFLISTAGLREDTITEPAGVTLGDDTSFLQYLMRDENSSYSAEDAINYLFGK